jgi:hypothetical protein
MGRVKVSERETFVRRLLWAIPSVIGRTRCADAVPLRGDNYEVSPGV